MTDLEYTEIRVTVPWGHIAGKAWGLKTNRPVLLLHGSLDNAGSFDRLVQLLPTNFYYVAIDLPGHGLSSFFPPGMPLEFYNYVHIIRYIIHHFKWDTCICIGHSLGSHLAVCYAALYPEQVEKVIVIDGFVAYFVDDEYTLDRLRDIYTDAIDGTKKHDISKAYSKEDVIYALKNMRNSTLNTAAAEALFPRSVIKVGDNLYKYSRDPRIKKRIRPLMNGEQSVNILSENTTPILAIFATESYISQYQKQLQIMKHRKEIEYLLVPGNHDVHNNNPEILAPHIIKYLNTSSIKSKL